MEKKEFLNRYLVDRHGTCSAKWDGLKEKFGEDDLLAMWIADMEFKTCDAINQALMKRVQHGVYGYTGVPEEYYELLSNWMERRYNFPIKKEWVRFSTGCVTGIAWSLAAFTKPQDACLILTPIYYPFYNVVTNNNRKLVTVELLYDNGYYTMDYDAIEEAIVKNDVKMFVMCSPHNPAGRVWTEEELDRVLAICQKHHVLVCSDEIHMDLVLTERAFVPAAVSNGKYSDIVITLNSATKSFNIATLLHSHIIITNPALREIYDRFSSGMNRTEVSLMGMIATMEAYRNGEEWLKHVVDIIRDNYSVLQTLADKLPGVTVCTLEGTYLAMVDFRNYMNPEEIKTLIQDRCRLAVDYGEWFGENCKGMIRMNLATDPSIVETAVNRIKEEAPAFKK